MVITTRINGLKTIPVSKDMQAIFPFGEVGFPCQLYHDDITKFYKNVVNWHWQRELEFSFIKEGQVELQILEHTYTIKEGHGYIIFPEHMHRIIQSDKKRGIYDTLIFSPEMIYGKCSSAIYQKYYLPFISKTEGLLLFSENDKWGKILLTLLEKLSKTLETKNKLYEITSTQIILKIWNQILLHNTFINEFNIFKKKISKITEKKIKIMLSYIQENYMNQLNLEDIAHSCNIEKGECCALFKKYLHTSPIKYVMEFRIEQSIPLLLENKLTVTDCALESGFYSINHYISSFKKLTGLTPRKFKQKYL